MSKKRIYSKDPIHPAQSQLLLYSTEDGGTRIEVRFQEERAWLNQSAMAEFCQSTKQNISLHLKSIFMARELKEDRGVKEYLTTAADSNKRYDKNYNSMRVLLAWGMP